jgi:hypothetical protein
VGLGDCRRGHCLAEELLGELEGRLDLSGAQIGLGQGYREGDLLGEQAARLLEDGDGGAPIRGGRGGQGPQVKGPGLRGSAGQAAGELHGPLRLREGELELDLGRRAFEAPINQTAQNAGIDGSIVCQKVKETKETNFGYNALTHEYGDLVKMGVIVPTKVERIALQNAASIASLLLTTDAIVSEIKEEKEPAPAGTPGGGMY